MPYALGVDAQALLTGDVLTAKRWLENVEANPARLPSDFNWHGFAQGAANNAQAAATLSDADAWASISVHAYERRQSKHEQSASFELSAMHLRSWMIRRYGASEASPVRNPRMLVDWFRSRVTMPLADAEYETAKLRALPVERWSEHLDVLRTLRALKNRINVLRTLDDPPEEIRAWLNLWSQLP